MRAKLLIVDDESEVLNALERLLRNHFELHMFTSAKEALVFLNHTHCHLILSDMKLPLMSGAEFLSHATKLSPLSKKIVLTGHADIEEAKEVVNNASISRYFTKPWKNKELLAGLSELVTLYNEELKHKRVIHSLKGSNYQLSLAKEVLNNTIENMTVEHSQTNQQNEGLFSFNNELIGFSARLINLLIGDDTGHNYRIAQQAQLIAKILGMSKAQQKAIYIAGLYYSIGEASLPDQLKNLTIEKMSFAQKQQWVSSVQISAEILRDVSPFKAAAEIVKHIYEHVDGTGLPDKLTGAEIPLGARILSLVIHNDRMLLGKLYQFVPSQEEALIKMKVLVGKAFDAKVLRAFELLLSRKDTENFEYAVNANQIVAGMMASQDVLNHHGQKLIAKNIAISKTMIEALTHYQETKESPVIVYVKSQAEHNVKCTDES
jgi:response regulator RpfG family c-di-GMP phosphodiesterase